MDYTAPDEQNQAAQPKSGVQWWIWVLVAIFACCGLLCAGGVGFVYYFGGEPENFSVDYTLPSPVKKGENVDLVITMSNNGDQPVFVTDIDLDEMFDGSILDGAIVLTSEPPIDRDYSISGVKTFKYNQNIQPGETKTVFFHLQATTVGEFGGPIGIYVGDQAKRLDYVGIIVQE